MPVAARPHGLGRGAGDRAARRRPAAVRPETATVPPTSTRSPSTLALTGVPHRLTYQPGVAAAVDAVAADGPAQAAFLVRPPTIAQIGDVAHRHDRMPAKTTYFWPKPRTGLVFRSFD